MGLARSPFSQLHFFKINFMPIAAPSPESAIVTAGIGAVVAGAVFSSLRRSISGGNSFGRRLFTTSLEVTNRDPKYRSLLRWLGRNCSFLISDFSIGLPSKGDSSAPSLLPAGGSNFTRWGGRWICVQREKQRVSGETDQASPFESITLSVVGRKKENFLREILLEAERQSEKELSDNLLVLVPFGGDWRPFGGGALGMRGKPPRSLSSVILKEGQIEGLVEDIRAFLTSEQWYRERGIPFRRGYLLHGPPGTGKSSLVHAIASHFRFSISVLSLKDGSAALSDDRLAHLIANVPDRSFLLIEDADAIKGEAETQRPSLSGLLNALDGVIAAEDRIVFMTTNHPESLNKALIRPGRIDVSVCMSAADSSQCEGMFTRFFPNAIEESRDFRLMVLPLNLSTAQLQSLLMNHKHRTAQETVAVLKDQLQLRPESKFFSRQESSICPSG